MVSCICFEVGSTFRNHPYFPNFLSTNKYLESLSGSQQLPMQEDSPREQNKETEAMCRISVSLGNDCQLPEQGLPLRGGPVAHLGAEGFLCGVPGTGCYSAPGPTLCKIQSSLFCVTVFSFHTGNWYSCMSLSKSVIMSLLPSIELVECQGSLCVSALPKCAEITPDTDSKAEKGRDLLTDTQPVNRKPGRPPGSLSSSPLYKLDAFLTVQIGSNNCKRGTGLLKLL